MNKMNSKGAAAKNAAASASSSGSSSSGSSQSSSSSSHSSESGSSGTGSGSDSDEHSSSTEDRQKKAAAATKGREKTESKAVAKKGNAIYSSESEESVAKPAPVKRRLSTNKPKATATVPVGRGRASKASARPAEATPAPSAAAKSLRAPKRSIFSPDNSSDSESKPGNNKKSVSSATSASGTSSGSSSSGSSSESESCSSNNNSNSNSNAKSKSSESTDKPGGGGARDKREANPEPSIVTRKLTRSASMRRSKHVKAQTDSDTESDAKMNRGTGKKVGPKGPIQRNRMPMGKSKGQGQGQGQAEAIAVVEPPKERRCPVDGCDSIGHLGGTLDRHFTQEACPLYHRLSVAECRIDREESRQREDERKRALQCLARRSPRSRSHLIGTEHRQYQLEVKNLRSRWQEKQSSSGSGGGDVKPPKPGEKNKEPDISNVASDYDYTMFRDAQAIASERIETELRSLPNVGHTKYIEMGRFEMEVWYQSPYPEDYAKLPKLYLCEFCLRYMKSRTILSRHVAKCVWRHPPGDEVYRKDRLSVWEVDGKRYKQYCQNLCLLAKFFLDHKTLYYDVEPFLFYVMTTADTEGCHTVGYFSKEKNSFLNYNVSCILTLPPYQRQGFGRLLIDFSYLLTREEGKVGSPEKPLSDLGLISYRSYWKDVLLEYLCNFGGKEISIKDISQEMAINSYDIVSTLQALGMMKYWKGKHIILKKQDEIEEYMDRLKRRDSSHLEIDPNYLKWVPHNTTQPKSS